MSDDTVTLGSGVYVEYVAMMASMGLWGITCMQTYVFTSSDVMPIGRSMLILTFSPCSFIYFVKYARVLCSTSPH